MQCTVCGGEQFVSYSVLWDQLIKDWQLSDDEVSYVNRQQGRICTSCGCNLRSIALANAISLHLQNLLPFAAYAASSAAANINVLEINEAGNLTPFLRQFSRYTFAQYPAVDIHDMPYEDNSFDLVVHSDTLEHVKNPIHALQECRRVLKNGAALCMTVPIIVGRLSRSREGLPNSYHGNATVDFNDWAVQTEFGADAWTCLFAAGFSQVSMNAVEYPAAIAFLARK